MPEHPGPENDFMLIWRTNTRYFKNKKKQDEQSSCFVIYDVAGDLHKTFLEKEV